MGSVGGLDRRASAPVLGAFVWSAGLLVAACMLPVYSGASATGLSAGSGQPIEGAAGLAGPATPTTSATLVGENGLWVLVVVAVPAVVTAVVWWCLRSRRRGGRWLACVLVGLLFAFCLAGALSIGLFVLPVAVLLAAATARTRPEGSAGAVA